MRITIDLDPDATRVVAEEDASSPFTSRRIAQAIDRYGLILRTIPLPVLSDAEWGLLLEAYGGTVSEPATVIEEFHAIIEDAMTGWELDRKWSVDARKFMARLGVLNVAQTVALVDQLERRRGNVVLLQVR